MHCLDQILLESSVSMTYKNKSDTYDDDNNATQDHNSCTVLVLSDRLKTLKALPIYRHEKHPYCTTIRAVEDQGTFSFTSEHGPFVGAGFYQDLAVVRRIVIRGMELNGDCHRVAFVGRKKRSSSQLIREQMEFQRTEYIIQQNNTSKLPKPMIACYYN
jgi:hypothetical protein